MKAMTGGKNQFLKNLKRDKLLLLLALPAALYFLVFHYLPMIGTVIAFQNFRPGAGLFGSSFVGLRWFKEFFSSIFFFRLVKNTFLLSFYMLVFAFPVPIIFALMLYELKDGPFRRTIQAVSFMPHFISIVVVVGILQNFLSISDGVINQLRSFMNLPPIGFLEDPAYFRTVYVASGIWQEFGWNSIIYIAAIAGISPQLYEAARIDGCSRFRQMIHITLPGIMPATVTLLILHLGKMMSVGFEKIILMYNPSTYSVADVISTYVYRRGIVDMQFSYAGAVDLFNSVINLALLLLVNRISRRRTGVGLF
ncbi:MAG: ABC transporter permease subunit [Treponema sp.]|jgi:putative aldouronate transport system permease protein|nr:ABC transporter permease subunit [Treponema sp.]